MEKISRWVMLLAMLLAAPVAAQLGLEQAADAYAAGDYAGASALWETAHQNGMRDGALYYNLGVAYYQAGVLDKALVNFLRATAYFPRETEIQTLVARIRAQRADPPADESDVLVLAGTFTNTTLTLNELAVLAFVGYVSFFGGIVAYVVRPRWQPILKWVILSLALVLFGLLFLLGTRLYVEQQRPVAVLIAPSVETMSGPGQDYLRLFSLMSAAEMRVSETRTGWAKIVLPDGRQGWLPLETIEILWESP